MMIQRESPTSHATSEPTHRPLVIDINGHRIKVRGDLDGSHAAYAELTKALAKIKKNGRWEISASDARVDPAGLTTWIQAARKLPVGVKLHYCDDYLGYALQFDSRYDSSHSTFERQAY